MFTRKNAAKRYQYEEEYGDIDDTEAEDYFMDESYMNTTDEADEYFD